MAKQQSKSREKNHLGLLCDIGELNALFAGSDNISTFLQQIVIMVAKHINADVCSIYLFDDETEELVLKATLGLNTKSVGKTRLKLGEGLVGLAVKEMRPICEEVASKNPHFKSIPGINEESYESFLVVPIQRGIENIGALVVQRKADNCFSDNDIMALKAITSQLAGAIENTRMLMTLHGKRKDKKSSVSRTSNLKFIKAEAASEGIAFAQVTVIDQGRLYQCLKDHEYTKEYSLDEFTSAVKKTEHELEQLQADVEEKVAGLASLIFGAHILMILDMEFTGSMIKRIKNGSNPPVAILSVANKYIEKFSTSESAYIREKAKDVEDVARRLLDNLVGETSEIVMNRKNRIVIAEDLYPSDMLRLSSEGVSGIILVSGGVTSHISILARSLQIPLVIADEMQLKRVPDNTPVLLDAEFGNIYINPEKEIIRKLKQRKKALAKASKQGKKVQPKTLTKDGKRISLQANINLNLDVKLAKEFKSEGIGLYRTEFSFMIRSNFPTEEEQMVIYSSIIDMMRTKPINIRTLDIGGEKVLDYYDSVKEANPTLGMRSIRFSLSHKDLFHQQLRAILRSGAKASDLRITFPMISSVDEFIEARESVFQCVASLEKSGSSHFATPKIGVMIETPAVIGVIDKLAQISDFLCIGTNDFIQYMLAVDRNNAMVASYYIPHHPSILRSLKRIASAAIKHGKEVSVCGEMAHEERYIPFLVGIGIGILSIDPKYTPRVQNLISQLSLSECEHRASLILGKTKISDVEKLL